MSSHHIAHVDAERGFSGGEVQVFLLLEGLRERGHRCTLYAPAGSRALEEAERRAFETCAIPLRSDVDLPSVLALARALRRRSVDLVHLHTGRATWLGGLAARLARLPALSTRRMDRRVKRGLKNRLLYGSLVRRVAAISPAVLECLLEGGVPRERIVLIPSTVDPERLRGCGDGSELRAALGASPGDVVALSLASLDRRKGLDVLLEALARCEAAPWLWLAGDGPEREHLEAQCARLGLEGRVRFLGRRADAGALLAAADLFVLPSRAEGLGVAALEAMAAGRPVLATRVGGLADAVVDEGTGLLVPPEDPEALAGALVRLVGDAGLRERLGAAGPAHVEEHYLPSQMVAAYEKLYAAVLAEAGRGRT